MIETRSARLAIIRATMLGHESPEDDHARYGQKIQRGRASSTAGAIAHGISAGEILAEVDRQREPVRSWLYAAYAEPAWEWVTYGMLQQIHMGLLSGFRERGGGNISAGRERALLKCVLNDKRRTLNNPDLGMKPGEYTAAIGIPRESWSRHYKRLARTAGEVIDDWDKEGRSAVAILLRRMSEDSLGVDYQELEGETGT